jgi:branched-chain amino acid transport system substrate-binding protein
MAGCTTQQTQNEQNVQVVKIGVIAPLSGPAAMYGDDVVRAYTYAVEEFNTSQDKYQMQLIFEDGKCDQKDATSAAQKLIDIDKVDFLL